MAPKTRQSGITDPQILRNAVQESLKKLDPRLVAKNPVMFVVEVGSVFTTLLWLRDRIFHPAGAAPGWFTLTVSLWLWFTVVFANFAEAVAEGRGKAQADSLRKMRRDVTARKLVNGREDRVPAASLRKGDVVVIEAGQMVLNRSATRLAS
jgi:K+-transporting ATPase ATPase B chain